MPEYTDEEFNNSLPRAISLAKCGGVVVIVILEKDKGFF
jgi:hypothetical protein